MHVVCVSMDVKAWLLTVWTHLPFPVSRICGDNVHRCSGRRCCLCFSPLSLPSLLPNMPSALSAHQSHREAVDWLSQTSPNRLCMVTVTEERILPKPTQYTQLKIAAIKKKNNNNWCSLYPVHVCVYNVWGGSADTWQRGWRTDHLALEMADWLIVLLIYWKLPVLVQRVLQHFSRTYHTTARRRFQLFHDRQIYWHESSKTWHSKHVAPTQNVCVSVRETEVGVEK